MKSAVSVSKSFRFFTFSLLAILLMVVIASASVSISYKKALIRYMKGYLGEHLRTELSMDDIRFRFLKGFPKVTVEITNVVLHSGENFSMQDFPGKWSDTLLQAKSLYLQFDFLKMMRKQYELKKIEITDGTINVLFDSHDRHNLSIWKSGSGDRSSYTINLRNIEINNTRLRVYVLKNQFALNGRTEKMQFKGSISDNIFSGDARGNVKIRNADIKKKALIRNSLLQLAVKLQYGEKNLTISQGKVQLNKAVSNVALKYEGKTNSIDLKVDIPKFGLDELMSIVPYETRFSTGNYHFNGSGRLLLTVKGTTGRRENLAVRSDFILNQCTARNTRTHSAVTGLHIRGSVSGNNSKDLLLKIDTLNASMGKGYVRAKLSVKSIDELVFKSEVNSLVDLEALKKFAGIDSIDQMSGMVYSDFTASGRFKGLTDSASQALNMLQRGNFRFDNAGFKIKRIPLEIKGITGKANWNDIVRLDSLKLTINESEMMVSGDLHNITGYFLSNGILKANLKINTDRIEISKYLRKSDHSKNKQNYGLFPDRIHLSAQINTGTFTAGKFEATGVKAKINAKKDSVYLNDLSFRFPDGSITGKAFIMLGSQHEYYVRCIAHSQNINIQQLFYSFNNFTQQFIIDKNLRGQLAGNIDCSFQWDSAMNLIPGSIIAEGDFQITNGELIQFEPMMKLSKYIDIDELRHIRFKTLSNTIHISNRMVDIPEMDIHSSAFNISVSGRHSFSNEFDYSLRVLLSEVLFNKARKKKKEIDEFLVEDRPQDRTTIPLIIAGKPDDFDVRFDRRKAFGLSPARNKPIMTEEKPNTSKNIRIEWDEPETPEVTEPQKTSSKPSDVVIEWEE